MRQHHAKWVLLVLLAGGALFIGEKPPDSQENMQGTVRVHDGDSLRLNGQKVRLWAIDAPEIDQVCFRPDGQWPCGKEAMRHLKKLTATGGVSCTRKGTSHDRMVGQCFAGGKDISKAMVAAGYALSLTHISKVYMSDERAAHNAKRGIWASQFHEPWAWRKKNR